MDECENEGRRKKEEGRKMMGLRFLENGIMLGKIVNEGGMSIWIWLSTRCVKQV